MEFLSTSWEFVRELIAGNWVTAGVLVLPFVLPNPLVEKAGYGAGRALSVILRQRMGKTPGEKVERYFQGSINALILGLTKGLDEDDTNGGEG